MSVFLMVLGAFLIYLCQKWLYITQWNKGLSAEFSYLEKAVTEGDTAHMREVLINRKRLPLFALQVKFAVSPYFGFEQMENTVTTDQNYRNDIYVLNGYEQVTRTLPFTCTRRGFFAVSSLELISTDLFHTQKLASRYPQNEALYVYPGTIDNCRFDPVFNRLAGIMQTRLYNQEDPFELRGIREYEPGDPMRKINWKISAHREDWMVNQYQYTSSQNVCILLDLSSDSNWKYEKLSEEAIRLAASFIRECISHDIPVSLRTNAIDIINRTVINQASGSGAYHTDTLLQCLSRIDEDSDPVPFMDILSEEKDCGQENTTYVLISASQNISDLDAYSELDKSDSGLLRVVPLHPDMVLKNGPDNILSVRWEVPYA